ncbi:MAG: hypothetical protein J3Q66DRAFT_423168 [Benniella sp.]|nr:MAG: hypothetical protein J3Q66DRAFT_423168 [Benniella sp.]
MKLKGGADQDSELALELCDDAEGTLSGIKGSQRRTLIPPKKDEDRILSDGVATAFNDLGILQDSLGRSDKAQASYKKAVQWGGNAEKPCPTSDFKSGKDALNTDKGQTTSSLSQPEPGSSSGTLPSQGFFTENVNPPTIAFSPPQADGRLDDIRQLAACLSLLRSSHSSDDVLEPLARKWIQDVENDPNEQERLKALATDVVKEYVRDELKDARAIADVVCLAPVLEKDDFRFLLRQLHSEIDHSDLLNLPQLHGLADLIRGADPGYLGSDDLVKILELLSARLTNTHIQSTSYSYQLTLAISHVLDAMADTKVNGLERERLHTSLSSYLDKLKGTSDPYLVYQAAYACQALQYVPDNDTLWQKTMRRTGKVIQGVSGLVSAVKGLDLNGFIKGLGNIQQGMSGVTDVHHLVNTAYKDAISLAKGGKDFLDCLNDSFSLEHKRAWYPALRGADTLILNGQLVKFKKLVYEAPCRHNLGFQWGICQRLGEIAGSSLWDANARRDAVSFLEEIYHNDAEWGRQVDVKQWIISILMRISSLSGSVAQYTITVLEQLRTDGDTEKQAIYQSYCEIGFNSCPFVFDIQSLETSPLLDRVQNMPDVEEALRQLRKKRLDEWMNTIFIAPQAKASLKAPDDAHFPLMESVQAFLESEQHQVFLLIGDSGAGKSTFSRALECALWDTYKRKDGTIPLYISLPTIDKPDQDMTTKHLRRLDFTDTQINELKGHRKLILICDGYDECQQTKNLYMSNRLNQTDEWQAKMVISCRREYIGADYRDRFQPGDRNHLSRVAQFQEAVFVPFSASQVDDYVDQYVSLRQPLWSAKEYKQALNSIPSLKELGRNPFLMTLSLEVLPRMMDPGEQPSVSRVTRVVLYDQFIEQWLERGKRRLGEKELSATARAAFDSLSDEGFTINGIDFLKKLSVAIYKEQDGQPVVEYSRFQDEGSWKTAFFSRDDETYLLREACPLTKSGNQYRFIHRSMLEYGLARAIFDPQEYKSITLQPSLNRGSSTSSLWSFEICDGLEDVASDHYQEPDIGSPLIWRSLVNEPSLLQFLEERAYQEPAFKQQLLDYIERSKIDKKWRTAAANAITIMVRAGFPFISTDLQGIRIPGADLSYGMFDAANLQEADLRKVNLSNVSLRESDMSGARMEGVQFGELPSLKFDDCVFSCVYSPEGSLFTVLSGGNINVYGTSNWDRTWILRGHSQGVTCIAYSPDGDRIVSGSWDSTVRVWDVATGDCLYIFIGHTREIKSVAYSPQGNVVASRSNDRTVRLWDLEAGGCQSVMSWGGYTNDMACSPKGDTIALGCDDYRVRLWNVGSGEFGSILIGHTEAVRTIAY